MTRKEMIYDVAKEQFTCIKDENLKLSLQLAFVAGAKWADKNPNFESIWHDADKMPNKALPIIIEIEDDIDPIHEVITVDGSDDKFWKYLTSDRDITRWAYIKDLLPKPK